MDWLIKPTHIALVFLISPNCIHCFNMFQFGQSVMLLTAYGYGKNHF